VVRIDEAKKEMTKKIMNHSREYGDLRNHEKFNLLTKLTLK